MNRFLLLLVTFVCVQEAAFAAQPDEKNAPRVMDLRIQMIGLRAGFDLPKDVADPSAFLKDAKTQENMIWSRDFRVSTLIGREVTMSMGENSPMVTGVTMTPQGQRTPNVVRQQTGALVRIKSSVIEDQRLLLKLSLENSRLDRGNELNPAPEAELLQTSIRNLIFDSEIALKNGQTKAISCSQSSSDKQQHSEQAIILITAKVAEE